MRVQSDEILEHLEIAGRFEGGLVVFDFWRMFGFGPKDRNDIEAYAAGF